MNKEQLDNVEKTLREKVLQYANEMEGWELQKEEFDNKDFVKKVSLGLDSEFPALYFYVKGSGPDVTGFTAKLGYSVGSNESIKYIDLIKVLNLDINPRGFQGLYQSVNEHFDNKQIETAREKDLTLLANALGIKID